MDLADPAPAPAQPAAAPLAEAPLAEVGPPAAAAPPAAAVSGAAPLVDPATGLPVKVKTRKTGAEIAFRVMFREQVQLTSLADNKAHMMIQINGLIMSIMLASTSIILNARPWLRMPAIALATTALVSIIFAVLAARPRLVNRDQWTVEDVASGRANILFFGNFGRISEQAFVSGMREMFADDDKVYGAMSRHVFGLGNVVLRKFELLRIAYTVFLVGLAVSGVLFIVGLFGWGHVI